MRRIYYRLIYQRMFCPQLYDVEGSSRYNYDVPIVEEYLDVLVRVYSY